MEILIRRLRIGGTAVFAFLLAALPAHATDLDDYLESVRVANDLPALAAPVVVNGELAAVSAVGQRAAGHDRPVTRQDRFHLGSNTKSMTATLAGMMVDEGLLAWSSTLGDILGGCASRHERKPCRRHVGAVVVAFQRRSSR